MGQTISPLNVNHGCYKVKKFEYKWIIKNFKNLVSKNAVGTSTTSEYLYCNSDGKKSGFYLTMYQNGYNERVKNYLSIYLSRLESHEIIIQFTCAILDSKNKVITTKSIKKKMNIDSHLGWTTYCRRGFLLEDEYKILTDGSLTLNCILEVFENNAIMNAETEDDDPFMNKSWSNMSTDMNQLLSEGLFSDVTIKVQDIKFPVHKAILSARSAVFKTMMKSQLKGDAKEIVITDITQEAAKNMLLYIYSGDVVHEDVQTTQELYYAADKYELHSLKKICIKILEGNLDTNNAIDILLLGHRHFDTDLEYACVEFLAKNISEIQEKHEWVSLMKNYPQLANMVLKNHLTKS